MVPKSQLHQLLTRSRRLPLVIMVTMLLVLGCAIYLTARYLQQQTREQIIGRDGDILHAVVMLHADRIQEDTVDLGGLEEVENQMLVVLEASRAVDVMGTLLFDAQGDIVETFPPEVFESSLGPLDLDVLKRLEPISHYQAALPLFQIFLPGTMSVEELDLAQPIIRVNVPLNTSNDPRLLGVIQFLVDGHGVAAEFAALDRNLFWVGLIIFLAGGTILSGAVGWSLSQLRKSSRILADRTSDLVKANQELALAAKTSAVGSLTSHLIHGLKNPLLGLQNYVKNLDTRHGEASDSDWEQAIASTRRMQSLIGQVVSVLHEQETGNQYEVTLAELNDIITEKTQATLKEAEVPLEIDLHGDQPLDNRTANLVVLILLNLIQNAAESNGPGKAVTLSVEATGEAIRWQVTDQGPGLEDSMVETLFSPVKSTKEGGSGIGLAISKQLAAHLQAELKLAKNTPNGCIFALVLPVSTG